MKANKDIRDPVAFAQHVLGHKTWKTQEAILRAVAKHPRVAVRACHASSKTFGAAEILLWWLHRHRNGKVLVTSPSFRQVSTQIWSEVHKAAQQSKIALPPGAKLLQTELKFSDSNFAIGLTATGHSSFQGYHGDDILIIMDEAPGIDADIFEGAEGILAGGNAHILLLGNPTISSGPFHDAFVRNRASWKTFTISAFDTPNFDGVSIERLLGMNEAELDENPFPFLVTRRWVRDRYTDWYNGSPEQSPLWQSRVLGEFPMQSEYALIWLSWIEAAARVREGEAEACYAGIDVAGPGSDETVCYIVSNGAVLEWKAWSQPDPRGPVVEFLNHWRDRLKVIRVDSTGIGYHFVTHLRDQHFRSVVGVNNGEAADDPKRFQNKKAETYWALREQMQANKISGLVDPTTQEQLAGIRYEIDGSGRTMIESKESARRRGVRSPDRAEALILALPPLKWEGGHGIVTVPTLRDYRFSVTDIRQREALRYATGVGAGGFRLGSQEKQDALDDLQPLRGRGTNLRRISRKGGIFGRGGW